MKAPATSIDRQRLVVEVAVVVDSVADRTLVFALAFGIPALSVVPVPARLPASSGVPAKGLLLFWFRAVAL